jgi:hypothetical protein
MPRTRALLIVALGSGLMITAVTGCLSSRVVLVGHTRPPISPDRVRIYLQPPEARYEQIADLWASSRASFALTAAGKIDKVIERLKSEAAKLGANGILLHGVGDQGNAPVGVGVSTETNSAHSPYGLGLGVSALIYQKSGDADAIYLDSN